MIESKASKYSSALLKAGADDGVRVHTRYGGLAILFAADIGATEAIDALLAKAPFTLYARLDVLYLRWLRPAVTRELCRSSCPQEMIKNNALVWAARQDRQIVVRILLDQGLEAVGGVVMVPEAMRNAIQRELVGVLRMLFSTWMGRKCRSSWPTTR